MGAGGDAAAEIDDAHAAPAELVLDDVVAQAAVEPGIG